MKNHATMRAEELRTVAPVRERGLKISHGVAFMFNILVAPVRERGLKTIKTAARLMQKSVAPVRERGLKTPEVDGSESTAASLP